MQRPAKALPQQTSEVLLIPDGSPGRRSLCTMPNGSATLSFHHWLLLPSLGLQPALDTLATSPSGRGGHSGDTAE